MAIIDHNFIDSFNGIEDLKNEVSPFISGFPELQVALEEALKRLEKFGEAIKRLKPFNKKELGLASEIAKNAHDFVHVLAQSYGTLTGADFQNSSPSDKRSRLNAAFSANAHVPNEKQEEAASLAVAYSCGPLIDQHSFQLKASDDKITQQNIRLEDVESKSKSLSEKVDTQVSLRGLSKHYAESSRNNFWSSVGLFVIGVAEVIAIIWFVACHSWADPLQELHLLLEANKDSSITLPLLTFNILWGAKFSILVLAFYLIGQTFKWAHATMHNSVIMRRAKLGLDTVAIIPEKITDESYRQALAAACIASIFTTTSTGYLKGEVSPSLTMPSSFPKLNSKI